MTARPTSAAAGRLIRRSPGVATTMYRNARIGEIVKVILHADAKGSRFVEQFAPLLKADTDRQTLCNVWSFVKDNIRYVRDEPGYELVKSPGATWKSKKGDCKSMSVFIGSILRALGYQYFYRVARYDPAQPEQGHIYPIVVLPGGEKIVVDAVHTGFDCEYDYWKKKDYTPQGVSIGAATAADKTKSRLWPVALIILGLMLIHD